ncbi:hypothetical protein J6590_086117 [Homalodisca vitripennis]|nr:hypothetical protein J6590_087913 [Homalodisca vitripennis]KAG8295794.1 hypothetical protein J6590_072796 [Homalodisca vitripennis]KAG8304789.1 hypothetical protein J6590_086117 [Homalodisca vitripennis]
MHYALYWYTPSFNASLPLVDLQEKEHFRKKNPLHCGCEQQELWEWLRDHQKLVGITKSGLRCEQPPELRGMLFLELEPPRFCSAPLVLKLAIQDIQPFSVLVSWQSRNHSGLHGYRVAYHALDNLGPGGKDAVRGKFLDRAARSVKLVRLAPDTRYLICVLGLGNWGPPLNRQQANMSGDVLLGDPVPHLTDSQMSRCTEVNMSGDVLLGDPVPHLTDSQMSRCTEVILGFITCSWSFTSPQQTAGQHERRCVAGRSCSTPDRLADESMYRGNTGLHNL